MENFAPDQDSLLPKIDKKTPRQISASEIRDFYTAICAGKWVPAAKGQPDWAFNALNEFCRCCRTGLRKKSFGYLGSVPHLSSTNKSHNEPDSEQIADGEAEFYESDFGEYRSPTNLEELAIVLANGKLFPLDLKVPNSTELYVPHTARLYLIFFIAWREFDALKTVKEIHQRLIKMKAIPADPPHKETDSSRNTRTLLKRIGFSLADKGGRPKK
jgi:hypothetical protein